MRVHVTTKYLNFSSLTVVSPSPRPFFNIYVCIIHYLARTIDSVQFSLFLLISSHLYFNATSLDVQASFSDSIDKCGLSRNCDNFLAH